MKLELGRLISRRHRVKARGVGVKMKTGAHDRGQRAADRGQRAKHFFVYHSKEWYGMGSAHHSIVQQWSRA